MKLLFISDIHGNDTALNAILERYEKNYFTHIFCLGDMCGYLTGLNKILSLFHEYNVISLAGNHELMFNNVNTIDESKIYANSIKDSYFRSSLQEREYIRKLEPHLEITIDNISFGLFHGGPNNNFEEYVYPNTLGEQMPLGKKYDVYLFGHSHLQFAIKKEGVFFCNPGSVGFPRNGDFRAHAMIFDTQKKSFESVQVAYDIDKVIDDYYNAPEFNRLLFHNIVFGRSSQIQLHSFAKKFFSKEEEELYLIGKFDFYNTPFGLVLSLIEDNFSKTILYVIYYEDGIIDLVSNTLIYKWEIDLFPEFLYDPKLGDGLVVDKIGLNYRKKFLEKEKLKSFFVDEIHEIFNFLNKYKSTNVKI